MGGKLNQEGITQGAEMATPVTKQEVAMWGVHIAFTTGHYSLFKGRRQPKTWTPKATFLSDSLPRLPVSH